MKKYELQPTRENLIKTLCNDTLNRNKDLVYFYKILTNQEQSCTIALDGKWGSGKTFFVRQSDIIIDACNPQSCIDTELRATILTKLSLSDNNEGGKNSIISVYYDAWVNDNDTEPIFSLIYEITKQISIDFSISENNLFKFAASILSAISGYNLNGILETLNSVDPFTLFKKQKNIESDIQSFFTELLAERGNRLVVFIDELDRCKPSFAVHLLEQLKHYISDERITFVFSVNIEQLQHTIKHYYGINFDSGRYLDRFFDLRVSIPSVDIEDLYNDLGINNQYYIDIIIRRVIKIFNLELREISKFYSQIRVAIKKYLDGNIVIDTTFADGKGRNFIFLCIVPLLIGLKIADNTKYYEFISGQNSEPLVRLLSMEREFRPFDIMKNSNESFESLPESIHITTEELVNRVYDAIFVHAYTSVGEVITLGECQFSMESKLFAIKVSSMMSNFADLS